MNNNMDDKIDCIIVGAGLAGISAAYKLAENGLNVVVFERGSHPGSKNMMGGILFTTMLGKLIPDFWKDAPLERRVVSRKFAMLSRETEMSFNFSTGRYGLPPFNNTFTALRAKFDRWFAEKAEERGAMILDGVVVDDLLWAGGKCVGVRTRLQEGDINCDCVILAEGTNGLLSEKAGLRKRSRSGEMAVGVKEIIEMPEEVIDNRFSLNEGEGLAIEYFGDAAKGMFGSGFLYTNRQSLSIGVVAKISDVADMKITCNELLEYFKKHPCIRNFIRGGKITEYSAHMLPEHGYNGLPSLVKDGLLLAGDSAGFLNTSHFHEGTNLAMASGLMAAETVIEAKERNDFSVKALSLYETKLKKSFVLKDMKKFRNFPGFFKKHPEFLSQYPQVFADLMVEYFAISELPKEKIEKDVFRKFRKEIGIIPFSRTMFSFVRGMGWI